MDLVTGALGKLPSKLLQLLNEEYKLQKGVRAQVEFLSRELESLHAALRKVAAVPWDQLDQQVKIWARDVREASYDMEDILDTFLVCVNGEEPADMSRLKRAMKKIRDLFKKCKARRDISYAIQDTKKQLQEMAPELPARCIVDNLVAKPDARSPSSLGTTSIDPRLSTVYTKVSDLIGIENPWNKVIKMLTDGEMGLEG